MVTVLHQFDAVRELLEVEAFVRSQRMPTEERDHNIEQIPSPSYDVAVKMLTVVVKPPVLEHLSHSKKLTELVETVDA